MWRGDATATIRDWRPTGNILRLVVVFGLVGTAKLASGDPVSSEREGLRLSAEPRRAELLVGEPLVLSLRFENISDVRPLRLSGPLHQLVERFCIGVKIRHESGLEYEHQSGLSALHYDSPWVITLSPQEYVEAVYVVGGSFIYGWDARAQGGICDENGYCLDFPLEGTYEVTVTYAPPFASHRPSVWQGALAVSGVRVSVVPPETAIDKEALKAWHVAPEGFAFWRAGPGEYDSAKVRKELKPFLDGAFSTSSYAPFARHLAALATIHRPMGESQLKAMATEVPGFILLDEVLFDLARAQQLLGKHDEAEATKRGAVTNNPKNVRGRIYERVDPD